MYFDVYCFKKYIFFGQVQLKEYVKLRDSIYEVVPQEEECFRFSRPLNFKVSSVDLYVLWKATAEFLLS